MRIPFLLALWISLLPAALPSQEPDAKPSTVTEITDSVRDSIVSITQIGRGGVQDALGTGFVISRDGLIATNRHVIGQARRIRVQLADGSKHDVAEIHATDATLDLAIIRIKKDNLTPLPLGDSDALKQGQKLIAIGHPQGLQFSVVEGLVSAIREVESAQMIQLAIPIEEGNSGGPVLDHHGKVQGVVTLKSALTHNLGFAHPVNALKPLLERPNPIPMSRWLTIGRLDEKTWSIPLGGLWTQHAGIIRAEAGTTGFGSRTLCLKKGTENNALPYEASVSVKLDDENGAAGLVFCADGTDIHYGFYPSNGKLRLTRFNGPDVLSWTVLHDKAHAAYEKGTWNTLRVRVDAEGIHCYVNEQRVVSAPMQGLEKGMIGLCKFRQPVAEFKNLRVGADLAIPPLPEALAAELSASLDSLTRTVEKEESVLLDKLLTQPAAAQRLLQERLVLLERQTEQLKRLESQVHRQAVAKELARALEEPEDSADLLRCALLVARHDNPDLEIDAYLSVVSRMEQDLKDDPALKLSTTESAKRLATYLFQESGFHGSRGEDMSNLSNSYLNEVLDDREGIPITLSILYLDLARRLQLKGVYGVGLPGRFMVACQDGDDPDGITYIDVFDGGKFLSPDEAEEFVQRITGQFVTEDQRKPATPRGMILRLLYNMTSFSNQPAKALPYLDLIIAIDPSATTERLNRALMRMSTGDIPGAKSDLKTLIDSPSVELDKQRMMELYHSL